MYVKRTKLKKVLDEVYEKIRFDEKAISPFVEKVKKAIEKDFPYGKIVVGGSFAKGTMIKKEKYDVDVFLIFGKKYRKRDISKLAHKVLKKVRLENGEKMKIEVLHGSRDYFISNLKFGDFVIQFEFLPLLEIKKGEKVENIIDISPHHVSYISKKLSEEQKKGVKLLKAFVHSISCYGAESHIRGFSGYSLELLIIFYKSLLNLLKRAIYWKPVVFVDIENYYVDLQDAIRKVRSRIGPILLVDPIQKERNALAALSIENFLKFKKACQDFLKNPNKNFFKKKKIEIEKLMKIVKMKKAELLVIDVISASKFDIAGAKIVKFYNSLTNEIKKNCEIFYKNLLFLESEKDNKARIYYILKKKKEVIILGPPISLQQAVINFKKKHKRTFEKNGYLYALEKPKDLSDIINHYKKEKKLYKIKKFEVSIIN